MDQVDKRGPGRPPKQHEIVEFFVKIPDYMSGWAISVDSINALNGDLAASMQSVLGETFELSHGMLVTKGGLRYKLVVKDNEIRGYGA
jgi:asparagine synthetase A